MSEIVNLEPRIVWEQFDAITQVPRPSKKEGKIIEFLVDFAGSTTSSIRRMPSATW